jgi:hypothetical protein
MWILTIPVLFLMAFGWLAFAQRKANSDYISRLSNIGFRMSGRIDARGGEAIVFDDSNQQAAFVKSNVQRILPYDHILQWSTEHQVNGPSLFHVHTADTAYPLFTFKVDPGSAQYCVAKMTAHRNRPMAA